MSDYRRVVFIQIFIIYPFKCQHLLFDPVTTFSTAAWTASDSQNMKISCILPFQFCKAKVLNPSLDTQRTTQYSDSISLGFQMYIIGCSGNYHSDNLKFYLKLWHLLQLSKCENCFVFLYTTKIHWLSYFAWFLTTLVPLHTKLKLHHCLWCPLKTLRPWRFCLYCSRRIVKFCGLPFMNVFTWKTEPLKNRLHVLISLHVSK